jgi:hypothetical protein
MPQSDLFLLFTEPLERAGLSYMVSGSVASMVYGEPRLTNDTDIVVLVKPSEVKVIAAVFPLETFYVPPEEIIVIESRRSRRGHFNLIHHGTGHKADVYLVGTDPLHAWGLGHRRRIELSTDKALWVAPPEYVILRKLEYFKEGRSEKHKHDIRGMLAVSGDLVDRSLLDQWIARLGVMAEWEEIAGPLASAT